VPSQITCTSCGRRARLPEFHQGNCLRCPYCAATLVLETAYLPPPSRRELWWPWIRGGLEVVAALLIVLLGVWLRATLRSGFPAPRDRQARTEVSHRPSPTVPKPPSPVSSQPSARDRPPAALDSSAEEVSRPRLTIEQIAARAEGAVALVEVKRGFGSERFLAGSGFLVRRGLLATNSHIIGDESIADLQVRFPSAGGAEPGPEPVHLRYEDRRRDLALLAVATELAPLELARDYEFRRGQEVIVLGHPGRLGGEPTWESSISQGLMSAPLVLQGVPFFQMSLSLHPGQSGGPVLDDRGRVVGVATVRANQGEGIAFCVPVGDLIAALDQADRDEAEHPGQAEAEHRLGIVLRRMVVLGGLFSRELDEAAKAAGQRLQEGGSPYLAFQAAAEAAKAKHRDLDRGWADLHAEVDRVRNDVLIAPHVQKAVVELWTNVVAIRKLLEIPATDLGRFRERATELRRRQASLVGLLRDVPEVADSGLLTANTSAAPESSGPTEADVIETGPSLRVNLSVRPEPSAGYHRVIGKVKNTSSRPLRGLAVRIKIRSKRGTNRATVVDRIVPEVLAPGAVGSFFCRIPIKVHTDHYTIEYFTVDGQPVAAQSWDGR
jgi:S1-C subfamily serine protease